MWHNETPSRESVIKPINETSTPEIILGTTATESMGLETTDNREEKLKGFRDRLDSNGLADEEYAEYRSLCMFPFDKRGQ